MRQEQEQKQHREPAQTWHCKQEGGPTLSRSGRSGVDNVVVVWGAGSSTPEPEIAAAIPAISLDRKTGSDSPAAPAWTRMRAARAPRSLAKVTVRGPPLSLSLHSRPASRFAPLTLLIDLEMTTQLRSPTPREPNSSPAQRKLPPPRARLLFWSEASRLTRRSWSPRGATLRGGGRCGW